MKVRLALAIGALAIALSSSASTTIAIYSAPPYPPNPPQNVLLNTGDTGLTVLGITNQSGNTVVFSGEETLLEPANGQARIEALDGGLTSLNISLAPSNTGFDSIEFNLNALASGTAVLAFTDQFGNPFSGAFAIGQSGSNFFTAVASEGELIRDVQIDTNVDLSSVSQVRLGAVSALVPEPAAWSIMVMGMLALGAVLRRRRAKPRWLWARRPVRAEPTA